ncbi:MAG: hypothetical protein K1X78_23525 [Verrucomicrobiaceae bacterium]|nr:hypothetical protein [Verrucomicrobiaceae bacterium]
MKPAARHLFTHPFIALLAAAALLPAAPARAESDEKPAKRRSTGPVFDVEMLRPLLRGTWDWKQPKGDAGGLTDIFLSFDENATVVGTARIVGDGGLEVSRNVKPARIVIVQNISTGLRSPEVGTLLVLPLPGIRGKPARLLLKAAGQSKLECIDLADTERPAKVNIVKTSDRLLHEIEGPGLQRAAVAPPADEPPPAAVPAPPPAELPAPRVVRQPSGRRLPMGSVFQRLKDEQAEKAAQTKQTEASSPGFQYVPEFKSRPYVSVFERLKTEQSGKAAGEKPAGSPPISPYKHVTAPLPQPPSSVYERLKTGQAEKQDGTQADDGAVTKTPAREKTRAPGTP